MAFILLTVVREACFCLSFTTGSSLSATHPGETHTVGKIKWKIIITWCYIKLSWNNPSFTDHNIQYNFNILHLQVKFENQVSQLKLMFLPHFAQDFHSISCSQNWVINNHAYSSSSTLFTELRILLEHFIMKPACPAFFRRMCLSSIAFISRLAPTGVWFRFINRLVFFVVVLFFIFYFHHILCDLYGDGSRQCHQQKEVFSECHLYSLSANFFRYLEWSFEKQTVMHWSFPVMFFSLCFPMWPHLTANTSHLVTNTEHSEHQLCSPFPRCYYHFL